MPSKAEKFTGSEQFSTLQPEQILPILLSMTFREERTIITDGYLTDDFWLKVHQQIASFADGRKWEPVAITIDWPDYSHKIACRHAHPSSSDLHLDASGQ